MRWRRSMAVAVVCGALLGGCDDSPATPAGTSGKPAAQNAPTPATRPSTQPSELPDDAANTADSARGIQELPATKPGDQPPAEQPVTPPATQAADTGELKPFTQVIPGSLVEFEMVPVPAGDGISPFYMGKTEVTWDEFAYWAFVNDVEKEIDKIRMRARKLRPSPPYDEIDRGFGLKDRPALGMSRKSAELYCQWLSEKTGRTYRLPTKAEWQHAFVLGYGTLTPAGTPEELARIAWFGANSENQTRKPGSLEPNQIGLYDMLGNVAEWVTETGEVRVVMGGHFHSPMALVNGEAMLAEDESWNANYPNEPKSIWWFVDADYVGFRLVCEPQPADAPPDAAGAQ